MEGFIGSRGHGEGEHWLTVSDLMAGLMMVFLFIAVSLMRSASEVAVDYIDSRMEIYNALEKAFRDDLERWNADIVEEHLSFEFKGPDVLFEAGSEVLRPRFEEILGDFFPRYVQTLDPLKGSIEEIRVEGHTSSEWGDAQPKEAYFKNMQLSQDRAHSVLRHVFELLQVDEERNWVEEHMVAVGYSSSRSKMSPDASRRVEFRILTNADDQIRKIMGQ
ncbi:MAG: OmpA family protein [Gammaproteobacteria bacterium]|nr:OmpA family protein [Gammaproteobacteria bacterium]MCY4255167.1 OmpA family protein [Gammaproteobacteria bacterium]